MENEVYSQGDYVRMNISQKIEFIHRVHVGELDIWDEYGNESFIWDDFHAVTDELREHPEWFSLEDLLQVMGITNDRCFELSWQNQLAEMIYAAFMHHGKAGVEFYLQHLQDVPQTGQFHGCHIPIQWLVREDKGYDILKEELYPLQEWYNELIDKKVDELTIFDALRMLRQDVCMDVAMLKTIEFLLQDVFTGEVYDGQALENLLRVDDAVLMSYADILQRIVAEAQARSEEHEWWYEGEKEEFVEILAQLRKKIGLKDGGSYDEEKTS